MPITYRGTTFGIPLFVVLLGIGGNIASAQEDKNSSAEAAIRQAGKEYLAAMETGDAKKIAEFWTADGTYTDEAGQTVNARKMIEESFATSHKTKLHTELTGVKIRLITPDVALEEGVCHVTAPGGGTPKSGCFSALWVQKDGKWKLANLRENDTHSPHSAANRLAVLEPFIGKWVGKSGQVTLNVSAQWNAGKTFLRRELSATADGKEVFRGSQIVGWDPVLQEIRSWTFNEDGGYSEGLWSLEGNVWMVASSGVKPNGETATTTQIFKFLSKDKMLWKLKSEAGEEPPHVDFQIELTRSAKPQ